MENYQMGRMSDRPYYRTCGCMSGSENGSADPVSTGAQILSGAEITRALQPLPKAMAYVPIQQLTTTYELEKALKIGTIFPQLNKPFCGKRGNCR